VVQGVGGTPSGEARWVHPVLQTAVLLGALILHTECQDDEFIVHFVTVVLAWPDLAGDKMNYELVIWTPSTCLLYHYHNYSTIIICDLLYLMSVV